MADLAYRANDIRFSVTNRKLATRVAELFDDRRPGVYIHISQHVVAQKRLNTGYNKCYLSSDNKGWRRLYLPGDPIHESRGSNPQTLPKTQDLPAEYLYLLDWYLKVVARQKDPALVREETGRISIEPDRSQKRREDNWFTLSNFIKNFHRAYENFYESDAPFRRFREGPCIHFHKKAISIWRNNIQQGDTNYHSLLLNDEYLDAIYATLTAWGMNRLGGGPKLTNFDVFKENLISIANYLEEIRDFNILTIDEIQEIVKNTYSDIDPSENVIDLVAKSKTLHHLHPELFPPIDRRYILRLLTRLEGLEVVPTMNGTDFKNYWKVLCCFKVLINRVGEYEVRQYIGKGIMDTSITKIMDNAIVGFSDLSSK